MKYRYIRWLLIISLFSITFVKSENIVAEETIEPDEFEYLLPGQSWSFLNISTLTANQTANFEWQANQTVRGREVTKNQFETLQGMSLSERATYLESIGFTDGKFDSGRTDTGEEGILYFVFFNPEIEVTSIQIIIIYLDSFLQPWIIGAITGSVVMIVLAIILYLTIRMTKKVMKKQEEETKSPAQKYLEM